MELFKRYQSYLENTLARQDFDGEPAELYQPIQYVMGLGGKRLRPALTLAACDLFQGEWSDAVLPALGLELFHNFSLVHDDIMDQADKRRGKPTVHQKWDTNVAILSGDALLVKAYQYVAQVDKSILPRVLKIFSRTALEICEGQQMDMNFEKAEWVREEDYLEMIRLKTAVLLGCALQIGALIGKADRRQAEQVYHFGINAGLAFQIQDDWLDAFGDPEKFGKKVGGDILQDKKTLLMIYSRELDPEGFNRLRLKALSGPEKVAAYRDFFRACGAQKKVELTRDRFLALAHEALLQAKPPQSELQEAMWTFAQWLAHRDR